MQDELLLPILKHVHSALTHYTLFECSMLSDCVVVKQSLTSTLYSQQSPHRAIDAHTRADYLGL